MRRVVLAAAVVLLLLVGLPGHRRFSASAVSDGERLAMFSKPAVVRIIDGAAGRFVFQPPGYQAQAYSVSLIGLGSGFFISPDGYIATNAHVVSMSHDGEDKSKQQLFMQLIRQIAHDIHREPSELNPNFIDQHSSLHDFRLFHHVIIPDGSVFPFEIKPSGYGAPTGTGTDQGKDVAIIKIEVRNAPVLILGDSEQLQLQDHVTVVGYPGAADTFNTGTLDSKSALEASVTDGKLSARKRSSSGAPILQVSAPATHGNSGGPAISDKNEVVGLLTFRGDTVNGQEVSGFSFVVASSTVMEYVKAVGASNAPGLTDQAYREGLEYYWDSRFSKAKDKFEEVKRLFPQHSEVDRLIQASQLAIAQGKDQSGLSGWWIAIGGVVVLIFIAGLLLIAIIAFVIIRRRGKAKAASVAVSPSPSAVAAPSSSPAIESPSPSPEAKPSVPSPAPATPPLAPDQGMTVDLSETIAIVHERDTSPAISYGSIKFVSGTLAGQEFEVKTEGACIGRDGTVAQIVIPDPRISKRHLWIGVRDGRVTIEDQQSRNGTFVNDPKSPRITETKLQSGDIVILGETDVARFEYRS